jgi:hypothetical protein
MAKINARGAHEVARWEAFIDRSDRSNESAEVTVVETTRFLILLRSDGKLLSRLADNASGLSGGYSIMASFKPSKATTPAADVLGLRIAKVEQYLTNRGYRVNRLARR